MNQSKTTPKDFFLHLAATVFLYAAVIALINLAFEVANRALPDALQSFYGVGSIVWPISMLIVLVPVTYVIEWLINRDIAKMPEKKDIWIRRWRIYLTLFLTAVSIIVDLIVLINTFLNGEITSRFIYKVLIIIIVSGVVFAYYLLAKSLDGGRAKTWRTILLWLGIVLTLGAVVAGFIIVGSPAQQRAMRFDEQRVNDLRTIQDQVVSYWQRNGSIPGNVSLLNDSISGFVLPVDPETHSAYEYSGKSNMTFELCATFDLSSNTSGPSQYAYPVSQALGENWNHSAGHTCFLRNIDPKQYPVSPKAI